jgi:hypothetical protein
MPRSFRKDPQAVKDYEFNWSDWLGGDTIASHTVTASTGLTVDSSSATSTTVTVWVSGGVVGATYAVTCHIVTTAGREDDRTMTFVIEEM